MSRHRSLALVAIAAAGCARPAPQPPSQPRPQPQAPQPAHAGCRQGAIDHVVAVGVAPLQHQLDAGEFALPGGDRDLRGQIDELHRRGASCARGGADDCQGLAVVGQSSELFVCAVHIWQAECDAATPRSCLALSDVYSATYYMPSIRPFAADAQKSSELYARGTALYQQACDKGEPACRNMAFEPSVMRREPKRALGVLITLCDHGDGQACGDAGSSLMADSKDRAGLWKRGCYAAHPSGSACMTLAQGADSADRRDELQKRACKIDPNTCPRPRAEPPP